MQLRGSFGAALLCALQAARSRTSSIAAYRHVPPRSVGNAGGAAFELARARPGVVDSATRLSTISAVSRDATTSRSIFRHPFFNGHDIRRLRIAARPHVHDPLNLGRAVDQHRGVMR